jgi:DNA-binding NarL/FixJ family response regulator
MEPEKTSSAAGGLAVAAGPPCEECQRGATVLVTMRHRSMRRLTRQVVQHDLPASRVEEQRDDELLVGAVRRVAPTVLIVDTGDFPACCELTLAAFPPERVIVISPEPGGAYEAAALNGGAGGSLPRDRISHDLQQELRKVLGCRHDRG